MADKPACRIDVDKDLIHCSVPIRAQGAKTVFVNGIPWSLMSHNNHPHLLPCDDGCCVHAAPIAVGSPTVFVEKLGAGRVGDKIAGCTAVATGSPNVYCGP